MSICLINLAGCDLGTDAATRLAYDLQAAAVTANRPPPCRYRGVDDYYTTAMDRQLALASIHLAADQRGAP